MAETSQFPAIAPENTDQTGPTGGFETVATGTLSAGGSVSHNISIGQGTAVRVTFTNITGTPIADITVDGASVGGISGNTPQETFSLTIGGYDTVELNETNGGSADYQIEFDEVPLPGHTHKIL